MLFTFVSVALPKIRAPLPRDAANIRGGALSDRIAF